MTGQNKQQKSTKSQKLENGTDDIAEHGKPKFRYLKSSRSARSKQICSAESRKKKDQEIKTPDALKGGLSCGAITCRPAF